MASDPHPGNQMPDEILDQIQLAILEGRKIEAIKIMRDATGIGLKEAKDAVEALEEALRRSGPVSMTDVAAAGLREPAPADMERVREALRIGNSIEAIRIFREATGMSLKDARIMVQEVEKELRDRVPQQFASRSAKRGCLGVLVVATGAGVLLGGIVRHAVRVIG